MPHQVQFLKTPPTTIAVVRFHVASQELSEMGERMGRAFGTVMTELGKAHVSPDGPAIASYEPTEDGFDVAAGFRVPSTFTATTELERLDLDEVEAAHTTHLGSYAELPTAYADLQEAAEAKGRMLERGPTWEEYWSPPGTPDEQTRTEIYWPLRPAL